MNLTQQDVQEIPEELQELMVDKIGSLMFQRTIDRCAELLSNEKQNKLADMLENDNVGFHTVIKFLEENVSNFTQIAQEEGSIVAEQMRQ